MQQTAMAAGGTKCHSRLRRASPMFGVIIQRNDALACSSWPPCLGFAGKARLEMRPPMPTGEMGWWGRTVHIGPSSPVVDLQRVGPAPWPPRQRSRSDAWLWITSSPKSAHRGFRW